MKKLIAAILALCLIAAAFTGCTPKVHTYEGKVYTHEKAVSIDGSSMRVGNLTVQIPDGFEVFSQTDSTVVLSSAEYRCTIGFYVQDVSELDEAGTEAVLDTINLLSDPTDTEMTISGKQYSGRIAVELDDDLKPTVRVETVFTDTWYAYNINTNYLDGYSEAGAMEVVVGMLYDAELEETESRFDLVQ